LRADGHTRYHVEARKVGGPAKQVVARTPLEGIADGLQGAAEILLGEGRLLEVSKRGRVNINEKGCT
jgi:hypothetical protein